MLSQTKYGSTDGPIKCSHTRAEVTQPAVAGAISAKSGDISATVSSSTLSLSLTHMNNDCLVCIFRHLNVHEQYMLLRLSTRFRWAVEHVWRTNYQRQFDVRAETALQLLASSDLCRALGTLLRYCTALRNIDAHTCEALKLLATKRLPVMCFVNVEQLSVDTGIGCVQLPAVVFGLFPRLQSVRIRCCSPLAFKGLNVLKHYRNLNDLRLHECTLSHDGREEGAWNERLFDEAFQALPLKTFSYMNATQTHVMQRVRHALQRSCIKHCASTLHTLQLCAVDLMVVIADVLQLPKLQKLTVFTHSAAIDNNNNCIGSSITTITTPATAADIDGTANKCILAALRAHATMSANVRALHIKCHMNGYFLQRLLPLPNLHTFAWHSHLHVARRPDGEINWQTYDACTTTQVLQFIKQCDNLNYLDFQRNVHVTPEFINSVRRVQRPNLTKWMTRFLLYSYSIPMQLDEENLGFYEFVFKASVKE